MIMGLWFAMDMQRDAAHIHRGWVSQWVNAIGNHHRGHPGHLRVPLFRIL